MGLNSRPQVAVDWTACTIVMDGEPRPHKFGLPVVQRHSYRAGFGINKTMYYELKFNRFTVAKSQHNAQKSPVDSGFVGT